MTFGFVEALAAGGAAATPILHLLGSPYISHGEKRYSIADGGTRLLAVLAINSGDLERRYVAARLWPDANDVRAAGNLRTALWRLNTPGIALVEASKTSLRLREDLNVDAHLLGDWAARMISGAPCLGDLARTPWDLEHLEILPGWYDDWIVLERERLRQRLLHALEVLGERLIVAGRIGEAVEVALVAVKSDPLRESAERILIAAYLAEGNRSDARRCFREHCELVNAELGTKPSSDLAAMFVPDGRNTPSS
jgi:DNA-binding SARP family transcriptional activator